MVHPLDQYGLSDYDKLPAAPSVGKIVGKGKYAGVLWVLNHDRDTYYQIRGGQDESLCCQAG